MSYEQKNFENAWPVHCQVRVSWDSPNSIAKQRRGAIASSPEIAQGVVWGLSLLAGK